jgi:ABC-type polysaccharide/polyol phosphate transport system ATPase subunit
MTSRENIFTNLARHSGAETKKKKKLQLGQCMGILVWAYIDTPVNYKLCKAMTVRLAFAVALEPEILVIDEVLAGG